MRFVQGNTAPKWSAHFDVAVQRLVPRILGKEQLVSKDYIQGVCGPFYMPSLVVLGDAEINNGRDFH